MTDRILLPQELDSVLSIDVTPESSPRLLLIFGALLALFLIALGSSALFFWLWWRSRRRDEDEEGFDGGIEAEMAEVDSVEAS